MILAVALNPAVDVTYHLGAVRWADTNRVQRVGRRAGGKSVNVARVLRTLGHAVRVVGLAGGHTGAEFTAELEAEEIPHELIPIAAATRCTVTVVDDQGATVLNEHGPTVTDREWRQVEQCVGDACRDVAAVVLSGSLPPGVPADAYAALARRAASGGVPVVLDADGRALRLGVTGGPAIVKPNTDELRRATGESGLFHGAEALRRAGADAVVVSAGPAGLVACTSEGRWHARPPRALPGNPTGAGDAAVAALVGGLVDGKAWPARLADAAAASAAAVLEPIAGEVDLTAYRELRAEVTVAPWDASATGALDLHSGGPRCRS